MHIKFILVLAMLLLFFGLTNKAGISATIGGVQAVAGGDFFDGGAAKNKNIELVFDDGSVKNCSLQTRKSAAQNVGNERFVVSVNSSWICR
jgi:serine phosphatase RsbU (regulator of sigma subunit)